MKHILKLLAALFAPKPAPVPHIICRHCGKPKPIHTDCNIY